MEYPIYLGDDAVGTAMVSKEGLYYRIQCTSHLTAGKPFRVTAEAEHSIDLGLCVPDGHHFGLEVRVPMKKLGEGDIRFYIRTQQEKKSEDWFPISSEKPFPYIVKLKYAYMVSLEGERGIAFKEIDRFPIRQDNDQNP